MFIKPLTKYNKTTGKHYTLYQLCESYRLDDRIRHRVIIGLGKLEEKLDTVENVHHTHVWALTSGKNIVSMHVLVNDTADQKEVLKEIYHLLKKDFSVYFSTIQVETECLDGKEADDIDINAHSFHTSHVQNTSG